MIVIRNFVHSLVTALKVKNVNSPLFYVFHYIATVFHPASVITACGLYIIEVHAKLRVSSIAQLQADVCWYYHDIYIYKSSRKQVQIDIIRIIKTTIYSV